MFDSNNPAGRWHAQSAKMGLFDRFAQRTPRSKPPAVIPLRLLPRLQSSGWKKTLLEQQGQPGRALSCYQSAIDSPTLARPISTAATSFWTIEGCTKERSEAYAEPRSLKIVRPLLHFNMEMPSAPRRA
jgi:hypothetical protein